MLNTPLPPKRQKKSDLFISFYLDYHWKVMQTPLSRFYINKAFYTSLTTILYILFEICQILKTFLYNKVLSVQNLQIKKRLNIFFIKKQKNLQIKKTSSCPQGIFLSQTNRHIKPISETTIKNLPRTKYWIPFPIKYFFHITIKSIWIRSSSRRVSEPRIVIF